MAGQDPSRFDYLFEPIDGDTESAGHSDVGVTDDAPIRSARKRPWPWFAVVVATVIGVGVGLIVMWSRPVDAVRAPPHVITPGPPAPAVTSSPVVVPVSASVSPPVPAPEPSSDVTTIVESVPESVPPPVPPSPVPSTSAAARPPTPTVRAPMSVSPEPRPAFPNQIPPDGNQNRGGLLGRGGLL